MDRSSGTAGLEHSYTGEVFAFNRFPCFAKTLVFEMSDERAVCLKVYDCVSGNTAVRFNATLVTIRLVQRPRGLGRGLVGYRNFFYYSSPSRPGPRLSSPPPRLPSADRPTVCSSDTEFGQPNASRTRLPMFLENAGVPKPLQRVRLDFFRNTKKLILALSAPFADFDKRQYTPPVRIIDCKLFNRYVMIFYVNFNRKTSFSSNISFHIMK